MLLFSIYVSFFLLINTHVRYMFCYEALPKEIWQDIFRLLLVDDINKLYEVLPLNSEWSVVVGERLFRTMVIQREHLPWTAKRLRLGGWMGEIMSLSGSSFLALHQHEKSYIKRIFFSCFFCPGQEHNDIDCPPISQKLVDDIKLLEGISAISFICPNINFFDLDFGLLCNKVDILVIYAGVELYIAEAILIQNQTDSCLHTLVLDEDTDIKKIQEWSIGIYKKNKLAINPTPHNKHFEMLLKSSLKSFLLDEYRDYEKIQELFLQKWLLKVSKMNIQHVVQFLIGDKRIVELPDN